jgi:hypothetical protein
LRTPFGKGNQFGLGDIVVAPAYLDYHPLPNLFFYGGADVYLPTGGYKADRIANPGLNYVTIAPLFATTWLPTSKSDVSFKVVTEFNFQNQATSYRSGDDFDIDYAASQMIFPRWHIGASGYFYHQFTNDTLHGQVYEDGYRGQTFGIGPQIRYDIGHGGLLLQYEHEFFVENRPAGERVWLNFAFPL